MVDIATPVEPGPVVQPQEEPAPLPHQSLPQEPVGTERAGEVNQEVQQEAEQEVPVTQPEVPEQQPEVPEQQPEVPDLQPQVAPHQAEQVPQQAVVEEPLGADVVEVMKYEPEGGLQDEDIVSSSEVRQSYEEEETVKAYDDDEDEDLGRN